MQSTRTLKTNSAAPLLRGGAGFIRRRLKTNSVMPNVLLATLALLLAVSTARAQTYVVTANDTNPANNL